MMKRILFTVAMLWSIAYGQSKVFIRGDSIVIQKVGGNGELIVENGTRNVTGGVLTNMGNGRTRFVLPSGGGGSTDSSFVSATFGSNKRQVGTRWNRNMQSGSLGFVDVTPNATVTANASGITIDGGTVGVTDYLETPDSVGLFSGHDYTMTLDFVAVNRNNTSQGIGVSWMPVGNGQGLHTFIRLTDTTSSGGYITYNFANSIPDFSATNTRSNYLFKHTAGDTLRLILQRQSFKWSATVVNYRNKSVMRLDLPEVQTTVSKLRLYGLGGEWRFIGRWNITYQSIYEPEWFHFGSSIGVALTGNSEGSRNQTMYYAGLPGGVVDFTGASEQITDVYNKITEAATYFGIPEHVVIESNSVNAFGGGTNLDSVSARWTRLLQIIQAWGVTKVYGINGTPQGAGDIRPYNDTMTAVFNRFGYEVFDAYSILVNTTGTAMWPGFDYGDGIHEGQKAMDVKGPAFREWLRVRGEITEGSPINIPYTPITRFYTHELVQLLNGDVAKAVAGTNEGYVWIKKETLTNSSRGQEGNIFLSTGGATIWADAVLAGTNKNLGRAGASAGMDGSGVYGNDGTFYQSLLVGTGTNRLQVGTTRIDFVGKPLEFSTSAPFNFNSIPMIVTKTIPQNGTNNTFIVKASTAGGGVVSNTHRLASFMVDTDTVSWVAHNGGYYSRDASKYTHNFHSQLTGHSLVCFDMVDSMITAAGGGGGMTNPMTTAGDIIYSSDGSGTPARLGIAADGKVLKLVSGLPSWEDESGGGGSGWGLTGNAGTTAGTNYVGTSDAIAFDIKTNATQAIRVNTSQEVMIGSTTDVGTQKLQITGDQYIIGQIYSLTDDISFPALRLRNTSGTDVWRVGHQGVTGSGNLDFVVYNGQGSVGFPFVIDFQSGNALFAGNSGATLTPREALDVNGSVSIRTVNAGVTTSMDSVLVMEEGRIKSIGVITSGTYTPTLTNGANVTTSTAHDLQYSRVGSVVTVSGMVEITVTAGGPLNTELEMSLPVASNFTLATQAGGAGASESNAEGVAIYADGTDDRVKFNWAPAASGNRIIRFSFTYQIL